MIRWVNTCCEDLATWWDLGPGQSAIGYPGSYDLSEHRSGNSQSICPEVMMPERVAWLDRILRGQEDKWVNLFNQHYIDRKPGRGGYYFVKLDRLHNRIEAVWQDRNYR